MANIFDGLDFDLDDALKADKEYRVKNRERDGRVCACGHPVTRHSGIAGEYVCQPTKMECPCRKPKPVLESSNTRFFVRKTVGAGAMHALGRGLAAAIEAGAECEWIVDLICEKCNEESDQLTPVAVDQFGVFVNEPARFNALICRKCRS